MTKISLAASSRELIGKKVKKLRAKGLIPAVVYGRGRDPEALSVDAKDFRRVYQQAGSGTLVDLAIDEKSPIKVLLHEPQPHHLTGNAIHADLYAVKMDEEIETTIPINFNGQSVAVEELEGNFIANTSELTIRCLPGDLIPSVEVDISVLKTFDDNIRVSDLQIPENVKVMNDPEDVVALVTAPRSEEELEAELAEDKSAEEAAVEALGEEGEGAETSTEEGESSAETVPLAETDDSSK